MIKVCDETVKDGRTELKFRRDGSGMQRTSVVREHANNKQMILKSRQYT